MIENLLLKDTDQPGFFLSIYREESPDEENDKVAFMYGERTPRPLRAKSAPSTRLSSLAVSSCSTPFSSRPSTAKSPKVSPAQTMRRLQTSMSAVTRNPHRAKSPPSGKTLKKKRPVSSFAPKCVDSDDENETHTVRFVSKRISRVHSAKTAAIRDDVIAARSVTSENARRHQMTPEQAWIATQPMSQKRQQLKENLMEINAKKINKVENRMSDFLARYPLVVRF